MDLENEDDEDIELEFMSRGQSAQARRMKRAEEDVEEDEEEEVDQGPDKKLENGSDEDSSSDDTSDSSDDNSDFDVHEDFTKGGKKKAKLLDGLPEPGVAGNGVNFWGLLYCTPWY